MDKYLELIKQKKEKSSNRKPKYATRKLSIGLVSCMLGFLIFSSEPVAFAEEEPAANITDESAETPEKFEEENLDNGEENEKSENLNTGVTGPETTPVPTVSDDTVETTTEEADNIYLAKSKEIAIAKINELGLGDKATEFIDRVNDANDFDTLEAIVEEAKKASEENLAEPTDTGDQDLSDTPDQKEVIGKIVVYERKENGKIDRLTSEEIEQTNINLSQSGVELEKSIEAQNWFSFVSEKSENNQYEYSITTNTGYHIVRENVELPPSLATYAKQITTNNGTLTLMEGTQTYFLVVEKDKAPYEGSVGDIPENLDYQSEYAEKLEASRKLEAAKEAAKKALDEAGIESDYFDKYIDSAKTIEGLEAYVKEVIASHEATEADKAPYEGSVGDIPKNLDYQKEYAEKLEASRKLEEETPVEELYTAVFKFDDESNNFKQENISSYDEAVKFSNEIAQKYIDKYDWSQSFEDNTIVNTFTKKEVEEEYIVRYVLRDKAGKELKELQAETWTNWEAMEEASVATANTFKEKYGNFDVEATVEGLTYVFTLRFEYEDGVVAIPAEEDEDDFSYADLTSGSEDSENIIVGEGGEDTSYQDLTDNPGNVIEIKDSITVTHEDGTKTVITADDDKARETIAKDPEKVKSMVEDVKEDTKATKEDTSKTETKKVAVAKSNNPKTGVVGSIGVASILAAASAGLAVSKKRK